MPMEPLEATLTTGVEQALSSVDDEREELLELAHGMHASACWVEDGTLGAAVVGHAGSTLASAPWDDDALLLSSECSAGGRVDDGGTTASAGACDVEEGTTGAMTR